MKPRLEKKYIEDIRPAIMDAGGYRSIMAVPRITKIVVNAGVGEAVADPKAIDGAVDELRTITGQQPVVTRARKSEAAFKLRQGMRIGAKVTLRGAMMYEFLDRLISLAIPRIRDFRGLAVKGFDGRGNYNLGVKEQITFPEIKFDKIDKTRGVNVTIVTTAETDDAAEDLLRRFGMPFRRKV